MEISGNTVQKTNQLNIPMNTEVIIQTRSRQANPFYVVVVGEMEGKLTCRHTTDHLARGAEAETFNIEIADIVKCEADVDDCK